MSNAIEIQKYDEYFKINTINLLNQRLLTKLKIFVNSLDNTEIINGDNILILKYLEPQINIIACDLKKIIDFCKRNNIEVKTSDEVTKIINNYSNYKLNEQNKINLLNNIKSNIFDVKKYNDFQLFCDSNLSIKLRDYQYKSAFLLSNSKVGFDFSVPGAGKTIITYATYRYFKKNDNIDKLLIIGTKNAYNAWYDEYYTCFNQEPNFINLSDKSIDEVTNYLSTSKENQFEINFINYEKIKNVEKQLISFSDSNNLLIVMDEGHKIKNPNAKVTKVIMNVAKHTNYKIILTGTPMPNGYEDLYSLTKILSPFNNILPYNYSQLKSFSIQGISDNQKKNIMSSINPFFSRVSKKYLIQKKELLTPIFNIEPSELNDDQKILNNFLDGIYVDLKNKWESSFSIYLMKAILIRKMQISANPKLLSKSIADALYELVYFNDEEQDEINKRKSEYNKLKINLEVADNEIKNLMNCSEVTNIIKKYSNGKAIVNKNQLAVNITSKYLSLGKKIIIWDVFVSNMYTLSEMITNQLKCKPGVINGNVTGEDRQNIINAFRNGNLMVLIASPATLAESISLHKCCQAAIYVNRNFNAAQFIQSKDRIHRINMPSGTTATYYYLINKDSVDESVNDRLQLKEQRMLEILDNDNITIGDIDSNLYSNMSNEDVICSFKK